MEVYDKDCLPQSIRIHQPTQQRDGVRQESPLATTCEPSLLQTQPHCFHHSR